MAIQLQNKRSAEFSSASMSDLVFLLLIFFMITSTLVAPNAINIMLPKSSSGKQLASRNIEVYIDANKLFYLNPEGQNSAPITIEELLPALQNAVAADKSEAAWNNLANVSAVATSIPNNASASASYSNGVFNFNISHYTFLVA